MSVTVDATSVSTPQQAGISPVTHATPYAATVTADAEAGEDGQDLLTTWRSISACHSRTCAALERELGERHGLGVSDYEVLARLHEADEHKYRAQDLADAVHLSQSALSRLVDRLARHGLVQRYTCDMDRRGIYVQLTDTGEQKYTAAQPTHLDILRRTLPSGLIH
jgi:DNA-binding MarR family transcriptional regulator